MPLVIGPVIGLGSLGTRGPRFGPIASSSGQLYFLKLI